MTTWRAVPQYRMLARRKFSYGLGYNFLKTSMGEGYDQPVLQQLFEGRSEGGMVVDTEWRDVQVAYESDKEADERLKETQKKDYDRREQ